MPPFKAMPQRISLPHLYGRRRPFTASATILRNIPSKSCTPPASTRVPTPPALSTDISVPLCEDSFDGVRLYLVGIPAKVSTRTTYRGSPAALVRQYAWIARVFVHASSPTAAAPPSSSPSPSQSPYPSPLLSPQPALARRERDAASGSAGLAITAADRFEIGPGWQGEWVLQAEGTKEGKEALLRWLRGGNSGSPAGTTGLLPFSPGVGVITPTPTPTPRDVHMVSGMVAAAPLSPFQNLQFQNQNQHQNGIGDGIKEPVAPTSSASEDNTGVLNNGWKWELIRERCAPGIIWLKLLDDRRRRPVVLDGDTDTADGHGQTLSSLSPPATATRFSPLFSTHPRSKANA